VELFRERFRAMGSPCELQLWAASRAEAAPLVAAARGEVERLEAKYSRYRPASLLSRINASAGDAAGVEVDEETAGLLDYARTCFETSGGLFDPTSGILRRAWDLKSGRVPAQGEVDALLARTGWRHVRWQAPRLVLPLPGMELDFGGFVKEYAADRVAELCRGLGARHGLVDLGGDLSLVGPHPDGSPWRVGIRHPLRRGAVLARVALRAGGIATSGDYERFMIVAGRRYGHILDPRTGWPVDGLAGVSVVASHCLIAGSATTIAMLKGAAAAPRWLAELGLPHVYMTREGVRGGTLASTTLEGGRRDRRPSSLSRSGDLLSRCRGGSTRKSSAARHGPRQGAASRAPRK
jgi:thiamine biosynthesis lipoprotein